MNHNKQFFGIWFKFNSDADIKDATKISDAIEFLYYLNISDNLNKFKLLLTQHRINWELI